MNSPQITVLGGSSPFTAGLIDALVPACESGDSFDRPTLLLHGRSTESLALVARYAEHLLSPRGWKVGTSTSLSESLAGADIVVHQIRYGDLALRGAGERLCHNLNLAADETLGPAALQTAIRTMPDLESTSNAINRVCPNAFVLNLTNPLSAVTWAMAQLGVRNCVGLCELPLVTKRFACECLGVAQEKADWTYAGLNHRGFIDSLTSGDRDLLQELPAALSEKRLGGIDKETIASLDALPLKYFQLISNSPKPSVGRADALSDLRQRILLELAADSETSPPSMAERYMDWYPHSVVPLLIALCQVEPSNQMLNLPRPGDGLVVETMASVSAQGWESAFYESTNPQVTLWNRRFENHERHFLQAMLDPTRQKIEAVFEHDPMMPAETVESAASSLCGICHEGALNEC